MKSLLCSCLVAGSVLASDFTTGTEFPVVKSRYSTSSVPTVGVATTNLTDYMQLVIVSTTLSVTGNSTGTVSLYTANYGTTNMRTAKLGNSLNSATYTNSAVQSDLLVGGLEKNGFWWIATNCTGSAAATIDRVDIIKYR